MSALWRGGPQQSAPAEHATTVLLPMTTAHLDAVMAIETAAYPFPWSRGNFIDSIAAGYPARVLVGVRRGAENEAEGGAPGGARGDARRDARDDARGEQQGLAQAQAPREARREVRQEVQQGLQQGLQQGVQQDLHGDVLGYVVTLPGVDEMHLLNITVAPAFQRRGHARSMIDAVAALCRERGARELWLEVRASNARARSVYESVGFVERGTRKGYYPASFGRREDAVVMSLAIDPAPASGASEHALE